MSRVTGFNSSGQNTMSKNMQSVCEILLTLHGHTLRLYHSIVVLSTLIYTRIRKKCSIILTTIVSRSYSPVDRVVKVFRPLFFCFGMLYFILKRLSPSSLTKGLRRVKCSPESPWHLKTYLFFYNLAVEHSTRVLLSLVIIVALLLLPLVVLLYGVCLLTCFFFTSLLLLSEHLSSILPPIPLSLRVKIRRLSLRLRQMVSGIRSTRSGKAQYNKRMNIKRLQ